MAACAAAALEKVVAGQHGAGVLQHIADLDVDQHMDDGFAHQVAGQRALLVPHPFHRLAHEWNVGDFRQRHESEFDGIIGVMGVVGNTVGHVDDLHFQQRAGVESRDLSIRMACPSRTSWLRFRPGNRW